MGLIARRGDSVFPTRDDFFFPLEQHFNRFFDEFFKSTKDVTSISASVGFPRMDIVETKPRVTCIDGKTVDVPGDLTIKASVSGWDQADIQVEVTPENVVVISGSKSKGEGSSDPPVYHLKELRQTSFTRSVRLPDYVRGDPEATMKDGILTLRWKTDRKPPEPQTRRIAIKSE
jgi:HSP20 family molecular chaperone IbpA